MKLIVDEFIEHILTQTTPCLSSSSSCPHPSAAPIPIPAPAAGQVGRVQRGMPKRLIACLSAFTSQTRDVNVSLTSIEVG